MHAICIPVDDGLVWSHVTDVLSKSDIACNIATIGRPVRVVYASTAFPAHLAYGHRCDAVMQLIARASELHGEVLSQGYVKGLRLECEGCHLDSKIKRNQGMHQGKLVGGATMPGQSLHVDVANPVMPMGCGQCQDIRTSVRLDVTRRDM